MDNYLKSLKFTKRVGYRKIKAVTENITLPLNSMKEFIQSLDNQLKLMYIKAERVDTRYIINLKKFYGTVVHANTKNNTITLHVLKSMMQKTFVTYINDNKEETLPMSDFIAILRTTASVDIMDKTDIGNFKNISIAIFEDEHQTRIILGYKNFDNQQLIN